MRLATSFASYCILATLVTVSACGDDGGTTNEEEVITTVTLSFAPMGGGAPVVAVFDDPDGDGGAAPTVDPINLANGTTYSVSVGFENRLENPAEVITDEVRDEGDEHFVFLTGTAVNGPASNQPSAPFTHTYADMDANGLPIGLTNMIIAATGTGQLTVTLRHLPPLNNTAVKTADLPTQVKNGGFAAVPGATDVQVNFMATVP